MAKIGVVNNDSVSSVPGDVVCGSGQEFGVVKAQATAATVGLLGVWQTTTGPGRTGTIQDDLVEVNCEVAVALNDKLYLSASNPGKATNVAPVFPYFLGTVISKKLAGSVQKATISFKGGVCAPGPDGVAVITGTPATGSLTCVAVAAISDNDRFTVSDGTLAVKIEYQKTELGFTPTATYTAIPVYALTDTTAKGVAVATAAAIVAANSNLIVPVPTTAVINFTNKTAGTAGNVTIVITAGSMTKTGMSGGTDVDSGAQLATPTTPGLVTSLGLSNKGDTAVGRGGGLGIGVMAAGANGTVKVADSTNANGWKDAVPITVATIMSTAFNAQSTVISGLSAAKRYRLQVQLDANGSAPQSEVQLQPNGSNSGCNFYCRTVTSAAQGSAEARICRVGQAGTGDPAARLIVVEITPRQAGYSMFRCWNIRASDADANNLVEGVVMTSTDYTSLTLYFSAGARAGNLIMQEFSA